MLKSVLINDRPTNWPNDQQINQIKINQYIGFISCQNNEYNKKRKRWNRNFMQLNN